MASPRSAAVSLGALYGDLQILTFAFLSAGDVCRAARVCRGWGVLCQSTRLWHPLTLQRWPLLRDPPVAAARGASSAVVYTKRDFEVRLCDERGYALFGDAGDDVELPALTRVGTTLPILKCVNAGNERVGKTALLIRLTAHDFATEYIPTASDK